MNFLKVTFWMAAASKAKGLVSWREEKCFPDFDLRMPDLIAAI